MIEWLERVLFCGEVFAFPRLLLYDISNFTLLFWSHGYQCFAFFVLRLLVRGGGICCSGGFRG